MLTKPPRLAPRLVAASPNTSVDDAATHVLCTAYYRDAGRSASSTRRSLAVYVVSTSALHTVSRVLPIPTIAPTHVCIPRSPVSGGWSCESSALIRSSQRPPYLAFPTPSQSSLASWPPYSPAAVARDLAISSRPYLRVRHPLPTQSPPNISYWPRAHYLFPPQALSVYRPKTNEFNFRCPVHSSLTVYIRFQTAFIRRHWKLQCTRQSS